MSWVDEPFLVFDTETTGLDCHKDRIVEIGVAVFNKQQYVHGFNWLIQTGIQITPEVTAINNITNDMIATDGLPEAEVIPRVMALFRSMNESRRPVMAFNAIFDLRFLLATARRGGETLDTTHMRVYDPLVVDRQYDKWKRGKRTLDAQAARYGLNPGGHRALADAIVAGRVAIAQTQRWSTLGRQSTLVLHRSQKWWYKEWITNYRRWQESQGVLPLAEIHDWPYGGLEFSISDQEQQCLPSSSSQG